MSSADLMCEAHMQECLDKIMFVSDVDELTKLTTLLSKGLQAAKFMRQGLSKAASKMVGQVKTTDKKQKQKKRQLEENEAIEQEKKRAKVAEVGLKEEANALFSIDLAKAKQGIADGKASLQDVRRTSSVTDMRLDEGPILLEDSEPAKEFAKQKQTQLMLGLWGGQYKKTNACKTELRCQNPTAAGKGKEDRWISESPGRWVVG